MQNLLLRFSLTEWPSLTRQFPPGVADTVALYPEGTLCEVTQEIVPPNSIHVALIGVSDENAADILSKLPDWVVS